MKLYVCWGTFPTPRPGGHPCANAHKALREAGHDPEVVRSYGWTVLPDTPFNQTLGRKRAKELTGSATRMIAAVITINWVRGMRVSSLMARA